MSETSPCYFKDGPLDNKTLWLDREVHIYYAVAKHDPIEIGSIETSFKTVMYIEYTYIDEYCQEQRRFVLK